MFACVSLFQVYVHICTSASFMDFEPGTAVTYHSVVQLTTDTQTHPLYSIVAVNLHTSIVRLILSSATNVSRITSVFTVYPLVHLVYTLYLFFVAMATVVDNSEHGKETV